MKQQIRIEKRFGLFDLKLVYAVFRGLGDGLYVVTVDRLRKGRSNDQNQYLWGCVYPQVLEGLLDAGWDDFTDVLQVHALCLEKFAKGKAVNYQTGEIMEFSGTTQLMSTAEMSAYTDSIRRWAMEYLNIDIKDPDKGWKLNNATR